MFKEINFDIPLFAGYLHKIKTSLVNKDVLVNKDSRIVFTCGAAEPKDFAKTGRSLLMKYASNHLKNYNFFMAEKLFNVMGNNKNDLLSIEKQLTNYSDCIIIILESPSSFAELGAFSVDDELAKKMIVINDYQFRNEESFINLGPIRKVNEKSIFGQCVSIDFERIAQSFSQLEKVLDEKIKSQRNKEIEVNSYSKLISNKKERFYLVHDLISLFFPLTHGELIQIFKTLYGDNNAYQIHFDIALLRSLGFIDLVDNHYTKSPYSKDLFLTSFGFSYRAIRIDLINFYRKFDSRLNVLIPDDAKAA